MAARYHFGPFTLSLAQRSLQRDGVTLPLGGRAFDLLVALVERSGRLVSKDELLDVVWGRVLVEEGNLHVQVSALRKLLGAAAIQTIPGRGYRFQPPGPLRSDGPAPPPAVAAAAPAAAALLGREDDLAAVLALLGTRRLLSIVGPGGIGKTRLARAALAARGGQHADGAVLVELASLSDATLIPGAMASALQLQLASARDPVAALCAAVRPLRVLLLLDNAEHLAAGVADTAQALLQAAPGLQLLVTSQVPLKLADEQVYRLGGLAVPATPGAAGDAAGDAAPDVDQALAFGAIALFQQRVQALDRHFRIDAANLPLVLQICRQLDGIALAIELAAARCPLLGLQGLAQRLDDRLRLLRSASRTAPSRQQTLQAAMDWSHALLSAEQADAFNQLGVFVGGFTLPLAAAVLRVPGLDEWATIDVLAELVDRSLVAVESAAAESAPRYRLLETSRHHALDKLAGAGQSTAVRQRHAQALRAWFETAADEAWVLPEAELISRHEPELDNLRAALDWSLAHDAANAIALAGASSRLWRGLSLHPEGLRRLGQARDLINAATPPAPAARLWEGLAQLSGETASTDSRVAAQHTLRLCELLADRRGQYLALAHLAFSYRAATPEAEAAYARMQALEDPAWPAALRLYGRKVAGGLASDAGRIDEARAAQQARLALATAAGAQRDVNAALGNLADLALMAGDAQAAVTLGRALLQRLGRRQMATRAIALGNLLLALLAEGALAAARETLAEFVDVVRQLDHMFVMYTADAMAWLAAAEGRWRDAAHLLGYADAAYAAEGQPREPNEARARAATLALLQAAPDAPRPAAAAAPDRLPDRLSGDLAAGASLQPAEVCALALARA